MSLFTSFATIVYLSYDFFSSDNFIVERLISMLDGDTSGRTNLNNIIFSNWYNSNDLKTYIFGDGFHNSVRITNNVSHNDWLDLLSSFGVLGFGLYAAIFFFTFREIISNNWAANKKASFICLISIALITSVSSRWIGSSFAYSQILLLPYLLATKNKTV